MHVINHATGEQDFNQERNVLQESARITRGNVQALSALQAQNFDALILPGGFGAAKNLSNFATQGVGMSVDTDLSNIIQAFFTAKKPMGFACISPLLCAKVLGTKNKQSGVELTLGKKRSDPSWPYSSTITLADSFGNKLVEKDVDDIHVDATALIVTTPGYMKGTAKPHEVFDGVGKMVKMVLELTNKK